MRARVIALFFVGVILSVSALTGSVRGQTSDSKPIGKVMTATGSVIIEHASAVVVQANLPYSGGVAQTKVGDLVYKGDVVQTGADGAVGVTFTDGTAFNLTGNARMVLNEFVYDPNGKSNSTLLSLIKGKFTFIAGKVAKTGDMKIDTPTAVIGIRGTTPHVEISDDGSVVSYSTLIEEGKTKTTEKRSGVESAPTKRRNGTNLNICKGC